MSAWLTELRSTRTCRAYAGDVVAWFAWLAERGPRAGGRAGACGPVGATQLGAGAAASSMRRRLLALSSFYRYRAAHDLIAWAPTEGVARPAVDPDYMATVGLNRTRPEPWSPPQTPTPAPRRCVRRPVSPKIYSVAAQLVAEQPRSRRGDRT